MSVAAALFDEALDALEDEERRARARRVLVPLFAEVLSQVLAGEYVDKHEAARLGVEWKTVRREVPTFRVGRRVVAKRADVLRFVESRSVASLSSERTSETRVSPSPESGDSFEIALQRADKRRRAAG